MEVRFEFLNGGFERDGDGVGLFSMFAVDLGHRHLLHVIVAIVRHGDGDGDVQRKLSWYPCIFLYFPAMPLRLSLFPKMPLLVSLFPEMDLRCRYQRDEFSRPHIYLIVARDHLRKK